jgi:hypothetical protein
LRSRSGGKKATRRSLKEERKDIIFGFWVAFTRD